MNIVVLPRDISTLSTVGNSDSTPKFTFMKGSRDSRPLRELQIEKAPVQQEKKMESNEGESTAGSSKAKINLKTVFPSPPSGNVFSTKSYVSDKPAAKLLSNKHSMNFGCVDLQSAACQTLILRNATKTEILKVEVSIPQSQSVYEVSGGLHFYS